MSNVTEQSKPSTDKSQWAILAGLRFALAMVVVLAHLRWVVPSTGAHSWLGAAGPTAAVYGFLLISGYSIASSLSSQPSGYLRRRVIRIAPVYYACCALAWLPWLLCGPIVTMQNGLTLQQPTLFVTAANLAMLQSFVSDTQNSLAPAWTLSIECFFYLIAPWLMKQKTAPLVIACALSATGSYFWFKAPHMRLDYLWLAWAWIGGFIIYRHRERPIAWVVAGIAGIIMTSGTIADYNPGVFARYTIGLTVLLMWVAPRLNVSERLGKWLDLAGDISYPLYLAHFPVLITLYALLRGTAWNAPSLYIAAAIGVSVAIYYGFDLPMRKRLSGKRIAAKNALVTAEDKPSAPRRPKQNIFVLGRKHVRCGTVDGVASSPSDSASASIG